MARALTRVVIVAFSVVFIVAGIGIVALTREVFSGGSLFVLGALGVIAVAFERTRYRSEHADRSADPPGPGGGEDPGGSLEARFRRTEETFVDPTTRRRMRVHADPATGERRYVSEG